MTVLAVPPYSTLPQLWRNLWWFVSLVRAASLLRTLCLGFLCSFASVRYMSTSNVPSLCTIFMSLAILAQIDASKVKQMLEKGHTVRGTVRDALDRGKTEHLMLGETIGGRKVRIFLACLLAKRSSNRKGKGQKYPKEHDPKWLWRKRSRLCALRMSLPGAERLKLFSATLLEEGAWALMSWTQQSKGKCHTVRNSSRGYTSGMMFVGIAKAC